MAKLYFKYGTMKSGKTLDLIRTYDSYKVSGREVLVLTPSLDDRHGVGKVKSRLGVEIEALAIDVGDMVELLHMKHLSKYDIILVDEAQFFNEEDINVLKIVTQEYNIPVIAYGLKTDFRGKLFEGSQTLLELSEDISEIKAVCNYCGSKATLNLRLDDGVPVYKGDVVQIGDSEYIPVCFKHYVEPRIREIREEVNGTD